MANIFSRIGNLGDFLFSGDDEKREMETKAARPDASDETAWTGTQYWGQGLYDSDILLQLDASAQIQQNLSWVYICNRYNAYQLMRQTLRLYRWRPLRGERFLDYPAKSVDKRNLKRLGKRRSVSKYVSSAQEEIAELVDHPLLDLLEKVNPIENGTDLWAATEWSLGLTGAAYWWARRNALGEPYQLWLLESSGTKPIPGKTLDEIISGYEYLGPKGKTIFPSDQVVYFKYPNPTSRIHGLSPIAGLVDAVSINRAIMAWERGTFKNMARPDLAVLFKQGLTPPDRRRVKREWKSVYGGPSNAAKTTFLEGDIDIKQLNFPPKELAHLAGRKIVMIEIADGYGIPLSLLTPEESNRAVAQTAYAQYMRDTVSPKLMLFEQKLNERLVPMFRDGESLFVAFDECVPEDVDQKLKERESDLRTGYSTINELRAEEGLEPHETWGDKPIMPAGMVEFGSGSPEGDDDKKAADLSNLAERILETLGYDKAE